MPTAIQWTDETFNPWWGCERVSPGCAHCYADDIARHRAAGQELWGAGHGFRFFGETHWKEPLVWNRRAEREGRRIRVFCASMADVFEERPELEKPRLRLFELIAETPHLDWQLLTKRPEFARDYLFEIDTALGIGGKFVTRDDDHFGWGCPFNVWIGVPIENARFTWRADVLREIPAAVRFISAEPLLGSLFPPSRVEVDARYGSEAVNHLELNESRRAPLDLTGIDWVIIGGESGPGARPFHLEHAGEIIRAARDIGEPTYVQVPGGVDVWDGQRVAVFVKQLGALPRAGGLPFKHLRDRKGGDWDEWPADLRIREFPRNAVLA